MPHGTLKSSAAKIEAVESTYQNHRIRKVNTDAKSLRNVFGLIVQENSNEYNHFPRTGGWEYFEEFILHLPSINGSNYISQIKKIHGQYFTIFKKLSIQIGYICTQ